MCCCCAPWPQRACCSGIPALGPRPRRHRRGAAPGAGRGLGDARCAGQLRAGGGDQPPDTERTFVPDDVGAAAGDLSRHLRAVLRQRPLVPPQPVRAAAARRHRGDGVAAAGHAPGLRPGVAVARLPARAVHRLHVLPRRTGALAARARAADALLPVRGHRRRARRCAGGAGGAAAAAGHFEVEIGLVLLAGALLWRVRKRGVPWVLAGAAAAARVDRRRGLAHAQRGRQRARDEPQLLRRAARARVRQPGAARHPPAQAGPRRHHARRAVPAPERRRLPTSYYTESSGVGRALKALRYARAAGGRRRPGHGHAGRVRSPRRQLHLLRDRSCDRRRRAHAFQLPRRQRGGGRRARRRRAPVAAAAARGAPGLARRRCLLGRRDPGAPADARSGGAVRRQGRPPTA